MPNQTMENTLYEGSKKDEEEVPSEPVGKPARLGSPYSEPILKVALEEDLQTQGEKISVSSVVSEIASWYERVRNSMEYAEDEVLLRSAIERILRRHLILLRTGRDIAPSLVRELAWAKYVPKDSIPQSILEDIAQRIDLYMWLYDNVKHNSHLGQVGPRDYILQLLSVDIALMIGRDKETEAIASSFIKILEDKINIPGVSKEDQQSLVVIGVYRAFAKEDVAFLRYRLFKHYFGSLTLDNKQKIVEEFHPLVQKVESMLDHKMAQKVYTIAKKNSAPFLILKDVLIENKNNFKALIDDKEALEKKILAVCGKRYDGLKAKVRRAIARSTVFLFVTKAAVALFIEGTFEKVFYGQIEWLAISINTAFPPILLLSSLLFIDTPDQVNSEKIVKKIDSILFDKNLMEFDSYLVKDEEAGNRYLNSIFGALWIAIGIFVLWGVHTLLNLTRVNLLSQAVFIFFLVVVLFLVYRIRESAKIYNIEEEKIKATTLVFDFFFMPLVHLGQRLTVTVARLNVILMIFDLLIETPFKTLFSFFEQWFFFLRSQREKLD